jgi:hypothetical protein
MNMKTNDKLVQVMRFSCDQRFELWFMPIKNPVERKESTLLVQTVHTLK